MQCFLARGRGGDGDVSGMTEALDRDTQWTVVATEKGTENRKVTMRLKKK